ncbi:MAG: hypothetical protein ACM3QS_03230 [Bacteroidota bacterium]
MKPWRNLPAFLAAALIVAATLACAGGAAAPAASPQPVTGAESTAAATLAPTQVSPPATQPSPAIPERRTLTLEYPAKIRRGDSDIVRLTLEVDDLGNVTPTAETAGNQVTGKTIEIPNLYETHNVTAEARLDMAGMEVRPPELISEPLAPGEAVTFYWSVRPPDKGSYKGTVWLFLRFVDKVSGAESRRAVSAQVIEIQSTDLFGLPANLARTTGAVGSVVGGIVGFPFFEDIVKLLLRRRRNR